MSQLKLSPHLSSFSAWAFSVGTSIGWGSLVITSNTYLAKAGPLGSALGLIAGALVMLVVSRNYYYMMRCFPGAGGAYVYARECFGHDHGFLVSWFLSLTYLAVLWANATALPLFGRFFMGDFFEVGKLYTVFDYDVYLGEALLTIGALVLIGLVAMVHKRTVAWLMSGAVICFSVCITVCLAVSLFGHGVSYDPAWVPDSGAVNQIFAIAVISPWAFIGFESISHASEEFAFNHNKLFRVLVLSIVSITLLYLFVILLSASAYPAGYGSWLEYIRDLPNCSGLEALPAFYAARHYMGHAGVVLLMLALLSLIISSLIGNSLALSRLFYAMAKDHVIPWAFTVINKYHLPANALLLAVCISLLIPFVGRTAIGWIVDVTTIGATLVYGFVSACALRQARLREDKTEIFTGAAGLIAMICFGLYLLLPNLFNTGSLETETFFLFVLWSVFGFIYFRMVLSRDRSRRFGRSLVVWISLLALIVFVSLVWMSRSVMKTASEGFDAVEKYYADGAPHKAAGVADRQIYVLRNVNGRSMVVVVCLFGVSLGVLLNNYSLLSKRALENETLLGVFQNIAYTDPLTGVKSKQAFKEKEKETDAAIERGAATDFGLLVCDVNGLKYVNDTLGHKAGDEYIIAAARMICGLFVHSPVYRTGGDEFVVFLRGHDFDFRHRLAQRLREESIENIGAGEVVVSSGLSEYQRDSDHNIQSVFERADSLMYQDKKSLKELDPGRFAR